MKEFLEIPSSWEGQFIVVNGITMIWQDCVIHKGYIRMIGN